jgi:hypothetical protein
VWRVVILLLLHSYLASLLIWPSNLGRQLSLTLASIRGDGLNQERIVSAEACKALASSLAEGH